MMSLFNSPFSTSTDPSASVSLPIYVKGKDRDKYASTVGTESIQTPLNFSLFVILQPFAKII